jgi:hypothetical protein
VTSKHNNRDDDAETLGRLSPVTFQVKLYKARYLVEMIVRQRQRFFQPLIS